MKKTLEKLPQSFKPYFWDVDFEKLDRNKDRYFIVKRVIDRGTTQSLNWVLSQYTLNDIHEVILTARDISRMTANFWADMLDIDKTTVPCLQKPYSPIPFGPSH